MAARGRPSWRVVLAILALGLAVGILASSAWAQTAPLIPAPAATAVPSSIPVPAAPAPGGLLPSPVAGPLLGAVIALAGVLLSQWNQHRQLDRTLRHQAEQEVLRDARHLRDRRYDRESLAYEELVTSAWAMHTTAHRQNFLLEGETEEKRDAALQQLLDTVLPPAQRAQVRLTLDEDARELRDLYDQIWRTFREHQVIARMLRTVVPVDYSRPEGRIQLVERQDEAFQRLERLVAELERLARVRLDRLRQPIRDLPDPPADTN